VTSDLFENLCVPANQRGGAGPEQRRLLHMPPGDREHQAEPGPRGDDEREQLEGQPEVSRRDSRRDARADRDEA